MFCLPASVVPFDMEELMDSLVSGRFRAVLSSLFTAPVLLGLDFTNTQRTGRFVKMKEMCVCIGLIRSGYSSICSMGVFVYLQAILFPHFATLLIVRVGRCYF